MSGLSSRSAWVGGGRTIGSRRSRRLRDGAPPFSLLGAALVAAALAVFPLPGLGAQQPGPGVPPPAVRGVPGELSLEEALALAKAQAGTLQVERRSLARASLALREARAELGPRLSLSAAGAYLTNPPAFDVPAGSLGELGPPVLPITVQFPNEDVEFSQIAGNAYFELSLELEQPLFTWLKLKNAAELAGLGVEVSAVQLEAADRAVRRETAESYYAALLARESQGHLREMVTVLSAIETDRREAYQLGVINLQELLETQAQVAEAVQAALEAEENLATALQVLGFYTGLTVDASALVSGFPAAQEPPAEELLRQQSRQGSPVLKKAQLQVEQARKNVARLRGAGILRPDLALRLALEVTGQKVPWVEEGWTDAWDANFTIGLGAEGTLFDSGRAHWRTAQAEEALRGAEQAFELGSRQLELAVRRAAQELRVAQGRITAAAAALRARCEAEANAQAAFAEDLLTRQQRGLARLERLRGEIGLLRARHAAAVAAARLEYLTGRPLGGSELQKR